MEYENDTFYVQNYKESMNASWKSSSSRSRPQRFNSKWNRSSGNSTRLPRQSAKGHNLTKERNPADENGNISR